MSAAKLIIAGVILLAFGGGYFVALPDENAATVLKAQLDLVENRNSMLLESNTELTETLRLIRRQVQTDRIAYESLKKDVDESERQRTVMQEKFESQRALLERLKKKIEQL